MIGRGIAARIALAALISAAVGLAILAVGVTVVGAESFKTLMDEAGISADHAQQMYDQSVSTVVVVAVVVAALASIGLAVLMARMLARPLAEVGAAARRIAAGDYAARVPRDGPEETRLAGRLLQPDGRRARAPGADAARLHRQRGARAANAADQPAGLPGGAPRRRHRRRPGDLRIAAGTRPSAWSGCRARSTRWPTATPAAPRAAVELDLAAAIRAALDLAQPTLERAGLHLVVDVPDRLPARANPDDLAQVLGNLLSNAARYTPAGGTVTVRAERRPADLLVSVANTGDGIPADDLERVFERFYRVEKSRDRARGGAGIGLAIVKQLVEAGGGQVGAESADGQTRFWFSLPT